MGLKVYPPWADAQQRKDWFATLARTVCVDFDGTLHPYTAGWCGSVPADEPPILGAGEFLTNLHRLGYRIVIFSTRADHQDGLDGITAWMDKHRLEYDAITHEKVGAIAYVDDRAVPFTGDWQAVLSGISALVGQSPYGP